MSRLARLWFEESADYEHAIAFDTFDDLQRGLQCIKTRRNLKNCLLMLRGTNRVVYAALVLPNDTQIVELDVLLSPVTQDMPGKLVPRREQCMVLHMVCNKLLVHSVCFI